MSNLHDRLGKLQLALDTKLAARLSELQATEPAPEPKAKCEVCNDMGMVKVNVPRDHHLWGKFVACPNKRCEVGTANRKRAWEGRIKASGLPDMYRGLTFKTWGKLSPKEQRGKTLAHEACLLFVNSEEYTFSLNDAARELGGQMDERYDREKNCLFLYGPVGTGKTGLAAAVMNELMAKQQPVLYIRARDLIKNVQDRYGKDEPPTAFEVQEMFSRSPLLIVDEFNIHNPTPDRLEIIESVIRARYGNRLPTIMTANVNQQEFDAMWGERTADVVKAMAHWIRVDGVKLRKTEAEVEENL